MKKLILFSLIVLSNIASYGQNFPGTNVELLIGKELKVKEKDESLQRYGYNDFYSDGALKRKFNCCENKQNTRYKTLVGKIFKMLSFEAYTDLMGIDKFKLKIENPEVGIMYYDYDPRFELEFEFEVIGGLTYPEDFFCKNIVSTNDMFTGELDYASPFAPVEFYKIIKGNTARTQITLKSQAPILTLNVKGVIILLENGFRIERPEAKIEIKKIKALDGSDAFMYTSVFDLGENDIKLLAENRMIKYRLFKHDTNVTMGETLMNYMRCIAAK
jgi:hypothetical protein